MAMKITKRVKPFQTEAARDTPPRFTVSARSHAVPRRPQNHAGPRPTYQAVSTTGIR